MTCIHERELNLVQEKSQIRLTFGHRLDFSSLMEHINFTAQNDIFIHLDISCLNKTHCEKSDRVIG